jgi:hypothetical protein
MTSQGAIVEQQFSSVDRNFVIATAALIGSAKTQPRLFGQICRLLGHDRAGTGFAHPGR